VATHGGELEGTIFFRTPNFILLFAKHTNELLYQQNLSIDVNIFSQFSCF